MRLNTIASILLSTTVLSSGLVSAKEGMFTPQQLPEIQADLKQSGLSFSPEQLSQLTQFPMGAVVSLGGCSASFVSDIGLVVTNHHCARGSVQYNSTPEHNYLENGFLAKNLAEELPAAPGSRIYVTTDFSDVTDKVIGGLSADMNGRARYDAIESNIKSLVAECEQEDGVRCSVPAFFGGMEYKLIKQMEIRDVRLVYSPSDSVGKYGGDIDNWMWPRHTGDFAFYRAYVGKDGKPADFSEDNVPYEPEHVLTVSAKGVADGDFVMVAGYPGRTNRYARLAEVEHMFNWLYPTYVGLVTDWIETIEASAPKGSDARIKYESLLAGLNNFLKNTKGQLEGAQRVGLVDRRAEREQALNDWLRLDRENRGLLTSIEELDAVTEAQFAASRKNFWFQNLMRPQLLGAAMRLYRNAIERTKPDSEREPGYQERDRNRMVQSLQSIERRYDASVDKAVWKMFIDLYNEQTPNGDDRLAVFDKSLGLESTAPEGKLDAELDRLYAQTELDDLDHRLSLMTASVEELQASQDPFMQLAIALYDDYMAVEADEKRLAGEASALEADYMRAVIAWQKANGSVAYPDANSTLRISYGSVMGGSPKDGLIYEPFTRLEGITQKDTGVEPFNSPAKMLELIKQKQYGDYELAEIGSVPVNFLSDLDTTGGNSGSATLNDKAQLVGLLFDGTLESVNSDWDFDPRTTRSIHVDSRYMLWIMEYVDGANNLIEEMKIAR